VSTTSATRATILSAGRQALLESGYAALSTRKVAEIAGVPLSQIHYHFGSRHNLVLELLEVENQHLLHRQREMYETELPVWKRWEQACDYLDDDLASGYVRLLHEMTAAGWSDGDVANAVRRMLRGWFELLETTASKASEHLRGLGGFTPAEAAVLAGAPFLGVEALILLGFEDKELPMRSALRKVGELLRSLEEDG